LTKNTAQNIAQMVAVEFSSQKSGVLSQYARLSYCIFKVEVIEINKIIIDVQGMELLNEWAAANQNLIYDSIKFDIFYFENFRIDMLFMSPDIFCFVENKPNRIKVSIHHNNVVAVKLNVIPTGENTFTFDRIQQRKGLTTAQADILMDNCVNALIMVNAFLIFGNKIDQKKRVLSAKKAKNSDGDTVFVLRSYNGTVIAVPKSHHKSPSMTFAVRGHFRRYSDGKIVWIDEYIKGKED
jgi:hypothetical protein